MLSSTPRHSAHETTHNARLETASARSQRAALFVFRCCPRRPVPSASAPGPVRAPEHAGREAAPAQVEHTRSRGGNPSGIRPYRRAYSARGRPGFFGARGNAMLLCLSHERRRRGLPLPFPLLLDEMRTHQCSESGWRTTAASAACRRLDASTSLQREPIEETTFVVPSSTTAQACRGSHPFVAQCSRLRR